MATLNLNLGTTNITLSARAKGNQILPEVYEAPGGLYPLRMAAWEVDEYRIKNGWPVPIPGHDVSQPALVSCQGDVIAYRDDNFGLQTKAMVRWTADEDAYNGTDGTWWPVQAAPVVMSASVGNTPVFLPNYTYMVGREKFIGPALNFDADMPSYMSADMGQVIGGSFGYTVLMVGNFNSVYGNSTDVAYEGLWCPSDKTHGWVSVTLQGNSLFLETDQTPRQSALSIQHLLDATAPVMIALVFGRPYTTLYAGKGPSEILSAKVYTGETQTPLNKDVYLGRTYEDLNHCTDMALMDLGIYADQLSASEVADEFATLSSVYGGDK